MPPPGKRPNLEASRILFIRNLPFKCTGDDVCQIFSRYGEIRQVRLGNSKTTKGTAFVVFQDISDAKRAMDELSGFNVEGRYLAVLYFHPHIKPKEIEYQRKEVEDLRETYKTLVRQQQQQ